MDSSAAAAVVDAKYYGDVLDVGSLINALYKEADKTGVDLGEIVPERTSPVSRYCTAKVSSLRGVVRASLISGERFFSLAFDNAIADFQWGGGGTGDLGRVVAALAAWRDGVAVKDMRERFPFINFAEMGVSFEGGTMVEDAWRHLLRFSETTGRSQLVKAIYSEKKLHHLFPFFSHETLWLAFNPLDRGGAAIGIDQLPGGHYRISGDVANQQTTTSLPALVAALLLVVDE